METAIVNIVTAWGPPGALALLMWVMLRKSEDRETKKDARIQLLQNQLIESYDERITAADRMANALHNSASAMNSLTAEIRSNKHA